MAHTVTGRLEGLKASQKRALERTYHRKVEPSRVLSPELARHLAWISREIGRQVGVLINRRGQIVDVFVGDAQRIYLPDVGRYRAGPGRLRGIRHIHTVLDKPGLQQEDKADLTKLRLDAVATLYVNESGEPLDLDLAHLTFGAQGTGVNHEHFATVHALDFDVLAVAEALEEEQARQSAAQRETGALTRAVVVGIYRNRHESTWRLEEIRELAATAGVHIADEIVQLRSRPDPKYVVGRGKLEEVVLRSLDAEAELVIIDHNLTPAQARAIAAFSELKVIDRTQLILDIFAQHAQSRDGKLQVELAQLKYNLPRLTDMDAGLSRLTGFIGGRGPGETKLEINRRRARERITKLERQIDELSARRALRRGRRVRSDVPIVSIVGYTNAGKSTLLNRLTKSRVVAEDQLFATLDPTSRRLRFPKDHEAIITDTVGFIRDLPPDLMRAFRATLEELETADLLLHVADIADPMLDEKLSAVREVLADLHLDGIPEIVVLNKSDLVEPYVADALAKSHQAVAVSATQGTGLAQLVQRIAHQLWQIDLLDDEHAWAVATEETQYQQPS